MLYISISSSKKERDRLELFLPNSVDTVRLIIDLKALGNKVGVDIGNIAFNSGGDSEETETYDAGAYEVITLSFSFTSDYQTFKKFLVVLQESLRLIDVTNITIKTTSDPEYATYSFVVDTYWLNK